MHGRAKASSEQVIESRSGMRDVAFRTAPRIGGLSCITSFNDVPSLVYVDPKYLNWSTSSNIYPFNHRVMLVVDLRSMLLKKILLCRT